MNASQFGVVFDEFADMLFRHAFFRVGSREKAKDMTQDTFIRAWEASSKATEPIREWKPFLFRILNNLIVDEYRKKKHVSIDELEEQRDEQGGSVPDELMIGGLMDEVERADKEMDAALLQKALGELKESDRDLVVRRFLEHESIASLSRSLRVTTDAIYVRIHRALKQLQKVLIEKGYDAK
jgi:RNA polymerase sigma-70 factor (ECF subfamily)